jgi:hypothetical protein
LLVQRCSGNGDGSSAVPFAATQAALRKSSDGAERFAPPSVGLKKVLIPWTKEYTALTKQATRRCHTVSLHKERK